MSTPTIKGEGGKREREGREEEYVCGCVSSSAFSFFALDALSAQPCTCLVRLNASSPTQPPDKSYSQMGVTPTPVACCTATWIPPGDLLLVCPGLSPPVWYRYPCHLPPSPPSFAHHSSTHLHAHTAVSDLNCILSLWTCVDFYSGTCMHFDFYYLAFIVILLWLVCNLIDLIF